MWPQIPASQQAAWLWVRNEPLSFLSGAEAPPLSYLVCDCYVCLSVTLKAFIHYTGPSISSNFILTCVIHVILFIRQVHIEHWSCPKLWQVQGIQSITTRDTGPHPRRAYVWLSTRGNSETLPCLRSRNKPKGVDLDLSHQYFPLVVLNPGCKLESPRELLQKS